MKRNTKLDQFFTPSFCAQAIIEHFYTDLSHRDTVVDCSAGDGRFLMAIPQHVDAYGVEIDPTLIDEASRNSGREVLLGDFREIELPRRPTHIIGNPPYKMAVISAFLDRAYEELAYGGHVGWILPCYVFQTASTVTRIAQKWSVSQTMIPRNIFQGFDKPLLFARLKKDKRTVLSGFFLYAETDAICQLDRKYRTMFIGNDSRANVWAEALEKALISLGGKAHLSEIYKEIEGNRPTENQWWKAKIRQQLRKYFCAIGDGWYSLHAAHEPSQMRLAV